MKRFITSLIFAVLLVVSFVAADVSLDSISSSVSGDPGSTVTYTITYSNTGTSDITVSSTSTSLSDGTNTISAPTISSVSVPTGSSATVSFTLTIPSTPAGTYTGTITGTDTSDSTNVDSSSYTLTVNTKDAFSLSTSTVSLEIQDSDESGTFTITNDGSTTLSSWSFNFTSSDGDTGKILDNDDDEMDISFSGASSSLAPGASMTVTVTANSDADMDVGSYSGTIGVSATGSASTSSSLSLTAAISPNICEEGKQGSDFDIDIRNPDDGDDFVAGETIPVEVKIENKASDDLDVEVEVILYNTDTGDKEMVERIEGSIDEDETETFSIDLELPTDLDEDDAYELFVQVHEDGNEDDSCDYESVEIDLDREDDDAIISEASVTPETGLFCGDTYRVSLEVESTGADSIDDLYIELQDADLDVQESSDNFDLGDYNDDDDTQRLSFDLMIPENLEIGSYSLEAILFSKSGKTLDSELITITVGECTEETVAGDLDLDISENYTVEENELTIGMIITNTGEENAVITIDVEEVSWATLTGTEYLSLLEAGDEAHGYLYFTLDETTEGKHDLKITVTNDKGDEVTEIVTVDFGDAQPVEEEEDAFFANINAWFKEKAPGSFWIIVDIILVILAIVFLRMLFSKK